MYERLGWLARSESYIFMKNYSNVVKVLVIEDCIKIFVNLCQDAVMVDQYPRDTTRRKELIEQGHIIGTSSGSRAKVDPLLI